MSLKENFSKKFKLNHMVFWPPLLVLLGMVALSFINEEWFASVTTSMTNSILDGWGWIFGQATVVMVIVMLIVLFHPFSKTKIGGENAKPHFKTISWFAMALCASIAIGIVFWGVAEPIYHYASPPVSWGIEPFSNDSAVFSLSTIWVHWGIGNYVYYALFAVLIALAYYNFNQPFLVSSSLYFIRNKPINPTMAKIVDVLCLIGIVGGVSCSLGMGTMQISSGLSMVAGIEPTKTTWFIVAFSVVVAFTISSYTGLKKEFSS